MIDYGKAIGLKNVQLGGRKGCILAGEKDGPEAGREVRRRTSGR